MTVKGNHDCSIETHMWYLNTDSIGVTANVKELDICGFHLAQELY